MSGGSCHSCGDYAARLFGPRFDTCLDCYAAPLASVPAAAPAAPTLEQCENVAAALGFQLMPLLRHVPHYEESLRNLHALVAKSAMGDVAANARLAVLRRAFASDRLVATPPGQPKKEADPSAS